MKHTASLKIWQQSCHDITGLVQWKSTSSFINDDLTFERDISEVSSCTFVPRHTLIAWVCFTVYNRHMWQCPFAVYNMCVLPSCSGWHWGNRRFQFQQTEAPRLWCHRLRLFTRPNTTLTSCHVTGVLCWGETHLVSLLWSPQLPSLPGSWWQKVQPEPCTHFSKLKHLWEQNMEGSAEVGVPGQVQHSNAPQWSEVLSCWGGTDSRFRKCQCCNGIQEQKQLFSSSGRIPYVHYKGQRSQVWYW